ncbi:hypothetical protein [Dasineura jujubifolia toursvirus 2a]|nr:hypothetical protein [Dasineura jujubifolia toursvirus 2a]
MVLKPPVFHLRRNDFNCKGELVDNFFHDKIVVIFIYADFCGFCHSAAPEYQKAANFSLKIFPENTVYFGAIRADGNIKGEKECENIINKLTNFEGFPDYAILINGKPVNFKFTQRDHIYILHTIKKFRGIQ